MDKFSGILKSFVRECHYGWKSSVASLLRGTDIWSVKYVSAIYPIMQHCKTEPSLAGGLVFLKSRVDREDYGNLNLRQVYTVVLQMHIHYLKLTEGRAGASSSHTKGVFS